MITKKLIIFDLFGVLLSRSLEVASPKLSVLFGVSINDFTATYSRYETEFDLGLKNSIEFWKQICFDLGKEIEPKQLTKVVIDSITINEDVFLLINFLKKYFELALCSNYRLEWFKLLDEKFDISKKFSKTYISSQTHVLKPDKKLFDLICNEFNCNPEDCILVDDTSENINGFKEWGGIGIKFNNIFETEFLIRQIFKELLPEYNESYSGVFLLTSDKKVILQRRDNNPKIANPNKLSVFGGRSKKDETPIQCAKRELKEETRIDVEDSDLYLIKELSYPLNNSTWMHCSYYLIRNVDANLIQLNEGQFIEVWKLRDVIDNDELTDFPRIIIKEKLLPIEF